MRVGTDSAQVQTTGIPDGDMAPADDSVAERAIPLRGIHRNAQGKFSVMKSGDESVVCPVDRRLVGA